jgi:26S proteasome regulatory subunit T4
MIIEYINFLSNFSKGMFAIRADRDYVIEEDFMKAARKIKEAKKLESKMDYSKV